MTKREKMLVPTIDSSTLKNWIKNNEVVIVDVREPEEYAEINISSAHLLPLAQITSDNLPVYEGKKLVMQCRSGKRSAYACEILLAENPDLDVYNLAGGILEFFNSHAT